MYIIPRTIETTAFTLLDSKRKTTQSPHPGLGFATPGTQPGWINTVMGRGPSVVPGLTTSWQAFQISFQDKLLGVAPLEVCPPEPISPGLPLMQISKFTLNF